MIFAVTAIVIFTALYVGIVLLGAKQRESRIKRLTAPQKPVSHTPYTGPLYSAHGGEIRPSANRFI